MNSAAQGSGLGIGSRRFCCAATNQTASFLLPHDRMTEITDVIPVTPLAQPDWEDAVRLLEQAAKAGCQDPQALYLLAMGYKHLGRVTDARRILDKVADPDPNVLLQRGILAFTDKDFAKAAGEFALGWDKEPQSYAAGYNLLLARLCQGQLDVAAQLIEKLSPLAPTPDEGRFLEMLRGLLGATSSAANQQLAGMVQAEEQRLLDMISGLQPFEVVYRLLAKLVSLRPGSDAPFRVYIGAALVQARMFVDRCQWEDALLLLNPLKRRIDSSGTQLDPFNQVALCDMLGVCCSMTQSFEKALDHFHEAMKAFQRDFAMPGPASKTDRYVNSQGVYIGAWLEQNLALVYEWVNRLDLAEQHWNRHFDYLEHYFSKSLPPDYLPNLAFEGMSRLADLFSRKERWGSAAHFLQRAHRVRPADYETMERLFHLYSQLKRQDDARKILQKLREVKPNDPQAEMFELEVREVRKINEIDQLLADLRRVMQRFPSDARVNERAAAIVANLAPTLERLADQYAGQVNKVVDQMKRLPSYQINWPTVRDIMRDLEDKYVLLRRVAQRCLSHVAQDDVRRDLQKMVNHCDRKIEQCHDLGE